MLAKLRSGCCLFRPQFSSRNLGTLKSKLRSREAIRKLPKRQQQLTDLKSENFDVLVIGGGVVGCGCALEAATRGLRTALIEAEDFASGASCKSNKLIEGNSSHLLAAIQRADVHQIFMWQQLFSERATMLTIAPHLNRVQPMMMPIYSPLRLPFYWLGLKMYDAMAGLANVRASHFLSKNASLDEFPLLRQDGLLGSLVYYDAQLDDARMCLALAITAAKHGATIANYVCLKQLLPFVDEEACRTALVEDVITQSSFNINSRVIVNATGTQTDAIRRLDNPDAQCIVLSQMGTHIALPHYLGSRNYGVLFPCKLNDCRSLTMIPFESGTIVSSIDRDQQGNDCQAIAEPTKEEVALLLEQTCHILNDHVELWPKDVLSAWTGAKSTIICPTDGKKNSPSKVVSNYLLEVSANQMISLAGGGWSSYRIMAIDAINTAIDMCHLEPQTESSVTETLLLDGAEDYNGMLPLDLVQAYDLPMDVAQHLADSYGSNACDLLQRSTSIGRKRIHPKFPYIQAEVAYACRREYACQLVDVIARRLRMAFVDAIATAEVLACILVLMAEHMAWSHTQQIQQLQMAENFLKTQMGLGSIMTQLKLSQCLAHKCPPSIAMRESQTVDFNRTTPMATDLSTKLVGVTTKVLDGTTIAPPLSTSDGLVRGKLKPATPDVNAARKLGLAMRVGKPATEKPPTRNFSPQALVASTADTAKDPSNKADKTTLETLSKISNSKSDFCKETDTKNLYVDFIQNLNRKLTPMTAMPFALANLYDVSLSLVEESMDSTKNPYNSQGPHTPCTTKYTELISQSGRSRTNLNADIRLIEIQACLLEAVASLELARLRIQPNYNCDSAVKDKDYKSSCCSKEDTENVDDTSDVKDTEMKNEDTYEDIKEVKLIDKTP